MGNYSIQNLNENNTIEDLKEEIKKKMKVNVPIIKLRLRNNSGKTLLDDKSLSQSNVSDNTTLILDVKMGAFGEMKKPEIDGEYFDINKFVYDTLDTNDIVFVSWGNAIANPIILTEHKSKKYSNLHNVFRQQLPIPLLEYTVNVNKNINMYSIDKGFEDITEYDIRRILKKLTKPINISGIELYSINTCILLDELGIDCVYTDSIINYYFIPEIYGFCSNSKENTDIQLCLLELKDNFENLGVEYFIYLQPLDIETLLTNNLKIGNSIKDWFQMVQTGGYYLETIEEEDYCCDELDRCKNDNKRNKRLVNTITKLYEDELIKQMKRGGKKSKKKMRGGMDGPDDAPIDREGSTESWRQYIKKNRLNSKTIPSRDRILMGHRRGLMGSKLEAHGHFKLNRDWTWEELVARAEASQSFEPEAEEETETTSDSINESTEPHILDLTFGMANGEIDIVLRNMNCKDRLAWCSINRKNRDHCNSDKIRNRYIQPCRDKEKEILPKLDNIAQSITGKDDYLTNKERLENKYKNWKPINGGSKKRTMKKMRGGMLPSSKQRTAARARRQQIPQRSVIQEPESDNYLGEMLLQQFENEEDYLFPDNPSVLVNEEDLDPIDIYDMPVEVMGNIADNLEFDNCEELRNYCLINPRECAMDENFRDKYKYDLKNCKIEANINKSLKRFFQFKPGQGIFESMNDMDGSNSSKSIGDGAIRTIENGLPIPRFAGKMLREILKEQGLFNELQKKIGKWGAQGKWGAINISFMELVLYFHSENPGLLMSTLNEWVNNILNNQDRLEEALKNNFMQLPEPVDENWLWNDRGDWLYSKWLYEASEQDILLLQTIVIDAMYNYLLEGNIYGLSHLLFP